MTPPEPITARWLSNEAPEGIAVDVQVFKIDDEAGSVAIDVDEVGTLMLEPWSALALVARLAWLMLDLPPGPPANE